MGNKAIKLKDSSGNSIYPCPYFPVGSIYMSVTNTNPSTFFGGTWEQIKDKFLLACGSSYSNGATGGASSVTSGKSSGSTGAPSNNTSGASSGSTGAPSNNTSGSTALTVNQIPSHQHLLKMRNNGKWNWYDGSTSGDKMEGGYSWDSGNVTYNWLIENSPVGGNQGHTHTLSSHTHSLNSHTHTLNSHTHSLNSHTHSVNTMPPYLAVYVWKRTA